MRDAGFTYYIFFRESLGINELARSTTRAARTRRGRASGPPTYYIEDPSPTFTKEDLKCLPVRTLHGERCRGRHRVLHVPSGFHRGGSQILLDDPSGNPVELFHPRRG